jgi:NitT/TauT family transport system permease protein
MGNGRHLAGILLIIPLWALVSRHVSPVILPPISAVAESLYGVLSSPAEWAAIAISARRLALGWILAAAIGVTVGLVVGLLPAVGAILHPWIVLIQSIPRVSWILLAMFWFGIDGSVVVFLIVMTVVPFFIVNVSEALRDVRQERRELMDVFRLPLAVRISDVYLPSISRALRSAATMALSVGWKSVVMAELLAAPDGIGARLSWAQGSFDTALLLAWTVIIAAVALASNAALERFT